MKTDKQIYTLLGADPEFLRLLTDGIRVRGPYLFEALEVKGLERRTDGVLIPQAEDEDIWVIEFQAQHDPVIYHRVLVEMGLVGERHSGRCVRGFVLFASAALDPRTEPWNGLIELDPQQAPLRRANLPDILAKLEREAPAHPLLAVFLPYVVADALRLRVQAPPVYRRLREADLPEATRRHCLDVFQSWLMARFTGLSLTEILKMLGEMTPLEETRAYKELVAVGEAIGRKEGRKEGIKEGIKKGIKKGRQREVALVLRQLQRRVGPLADAQQTCVAALADEQLEDLGEALLDFTDMADLNAWLAGR